MAPLVYALTTLASAACAALLLRGHGQSRAPLLLAAALCFLGFALNDLLVFLDLVIFVDTDLAGLRALPSLVGLALLVRQMAREGA